jgi:hypothetical protein
MRFLAHAAIASLCMTSIAAARPVDKVAASPAASGTSKTFQFYESNACPLIDEQDQDCFVDFPTPPKGLKANITGTSCQIEMVGSGAGIRYVQLLILNKKENILTAQSFQPAITFQYGVNSFWAVNNQITAYADTGERAEIVIGLHLTEKGSTVTAHCHVSGYYSQA